MICGWLQTCGAVGCRCHWNRTCGGGRGLDHEDLSICGDTVKGCEPGRAGSDWHSGRITEAAVREVGESRETQEEPPAVAIPVMAAPVAGSGRLFPPDVLCSPGFRIDK